MPDVMIVELEDAIDSIREQTGAADEQHCPFETAAKSQCASSSAVTPEASDILLLASDGFWDAFTNEEAAAAITHFLSVHPSTAASADDPVAHPLFSALAAHLSKEAYLRGSMDNITVMVVHLECIKRWLRENVEKNNRPLIKSAPIATAESKSADEIISV